MRARAFRCVCMCRGVRVWLCGGVGDGWEEGSREIGGGVIDVYLCHQESLGNEEWVSRSI